MNEVTVNMDNLTTEEREQLLALVEKGNKKPFEVWKPQNHETTYRVYGDGAIACDGYSKACSSDFNLYSRGRIFKTKAEAEFFSEQERILTQYRRLAEESWSGEKIDWSDGDINKYFCEYYDARLAVNANQFAKTQSTLYFKTRESLKAAIKTIGEENIIKYLF